MNKEPVAVGHAVIAAIMAVINLLQVFAVLHWTADQLAVVNTTLGVVLSAVVAVFVRGKVTPSG